MALPPRGTSWLTALATWWAAGCGLFAPFSTPKPPTDAAVDGNVDAGGIDSGALDGALDAAAPDTGLDSAAEGDAEQPCLEVVGRLDRDVLSDDANVLAVGDDRAVLGEVAFGIGLVDVSDPGEPLLEREIATIPANAEEPSEIRDIALGRDVALVTERGAGLAVVDLENDEYVLFRPDEVQGGNARGVALRGEDAVVAWGDAGLVYLGLDPDIPKVSARRVDLGCGAVEVALGPDHAYVGCLADVRVVSLPPDDLAQVASVMVGRDPGDDARDLVLDPHGIYAWVAVDPVGLVVVSIEDPLEPVVTGVAETGSVEGPKHIARWGDFAVIAAVSVLEVFDALDPAAPLLAASYEPEPPAQVRSVAVRGDLAYVAAGEGGLEILDLTCLLP